MKDHWKQAVFGAVSLFSVSACASGDYPGPFGPTEPERVVKVPAVHSCDPTRNPERPSEIFTGYYGQRICMGLNHYLTYHQGKSAPSAVNVKVNAHFGIPYLIPGTNKELGDVLAHIFHIQAAKYHQGHDQVGNDFRLSPHQLVYHQCRPENKEPGDAVLEDINRSNTFYCLDKQEANFFLNPR